MIRPSLLAFLALAACEPASRAAAPIARERAPAAHVVSIKGMSFAPTQLVVRAGDTVEWKNEDLFQHTVTAEDRSLDSGIIEPGASWKQVLRQPGRFGYRCTLHPTMTGVLESRQDENL